MKNFKNKNKFFKLLNKDIGKLKIDEKFGINSSWKWYNDPLQFFISLARYKFVSKILKGKKSVLEIGCSDGFNSRIVRQAVKKLDACDIDLDLINNANKIKSKKWNIKFFVHNFSKKKLDKKNKYESVYLLDVLEHIDKKDENKFLRNIISSIKKSGSMVIGIPSIEFQKFSRPKKISGHINCKTAESLKLLCNKYFNHVIIMSMNDELVHTGFEKMSCYFFAICSNPK